MSQTKPQNIVIVGGSLGGLFMSVALKRLRQNLNIRILESNQTPLLQDQGAGLVANSDVLHFFSKYDHTRTPLTVTSHQRQYLNKEGEIIDREDREQQMTSWDLLYHLLRANCDGVKSEYAEVPKPQENEGTLSYEYGCTVTDIKTPNSTTISDMDYSEPVQITIKHSSGKTSITEADLVIAADGPSSTIRARYHPEVKRTYAGYVAWRGTVPEDQVSEEAKKVLVERITFFHTQNTQILAYAIPGKHGTLEPGKRLLNWVWYVNYKEESAEHRNIMTDKNGKRHHITLPAGGVRDDVWSQQKDFAKRTLPSAFAELVEKTKVPFIQTITDVISPSANLDSGRVLLIGDALAGVRPHTGMSSNQAALDAMQLAETINKIIGGAGEKVLEEWEKHVLEYAIELQSRGVYIGNRSQFGEHPKAS
jgi:2-polyprenyl-6-methoxyphenol hydroxylase-like FAD-dependent oxidoreductase